MSGSELSTGARLPLSFLLTSNFKLHMQQSCSESTSLGSHSLFHEELLERKGKKKPWRWQLTTFPLDSAIRYSSLLVEEIGRPTLRGATQADMTHYHWNPLATSSKTVVLLLPKSSLIISCHSRRQYSTARGREASMYFLSGNWSKSGPETQAEQSIWCTEC